LSSGTVCCLSVFSSMTVGCLSVFSSGTGTNSTRGEY
jgi:hypothetical protein